MQFVGRCGMGVIYVELVIIGVVVLGSETLSNEPLRRARDSSPFFLGPLSAALSKYQRASDIASMATGVCAFLASSDFLIMALKPFSADRLTLAFALWACLGVPALISAWKTWTHARVHTHATAP